MANILGIEVTLDTSGFESGISTMITSLSNAKEKFRDYQRQVDESKSVQDEFTGSVEDTNDALGDTETAMEESSEGGGWDKLKEKFKDLTKKGIMLAVDALKEFIKDTIRLGIDYTATMSKVRALSGATEEEMELLDSAAREWGSTTQFSATEAGEALQYMALAGWDAQQSVEGLGGILYLAGAAEMSLGEASDMVTDYLSAFNMEAKESTRMADILAYAQAKSNTSAEALGEAFQNSAAAMNSAGVSIETTVALLAMMANQGTKGSRAGTALKAMMSDLSSKAKEGAIQIGKQSVKIQDANGDYRNLLDILKDVEKATQGLGKAERSEALGATFTTRSLDALNLILNAGVDTAIEFEEALKGSNGAAKEMNDIMQDNLKGDLANLESALDDVKMRIFDCLEGPLRTVVQLMTDAIPLIIGFCEEIYNFFVDLYNKLQPLWDFFGGIADWFGEHQEDFKTFSQAAVDDLEEPWETTPGFFGNIWGASKHVFSSDTGTMKTIGTSLMEGFTSESGWNGTVGFFESMWNSVTETLGQKVEPLTDIGESLYNALTGAFSDPGEFFSGVANTIVESLKGGIDGVKKIGESIWNALIGRDPERDAFEEEEKSIKEEISRIEALRKEAFSSASEARKSGDTETYRQSRSEYKGYDKELESLRERYSEVTETLSTMPKGVDVVGWFSDLWEDIVGAFNDPIGKFSSIASDMASGIESVWNDVTEFFGGIWSDITGAFQGTDFETIGTTMYDSLTGAWDTVSSWADGIVSSISTALGDPLNTIAEVGGSLYSSFTEAWGGVSSWAGGVLGDIGGVFSDPGKTISSVGQTLYDSFTGAWNAVSSWASGKLGDISKAFGDPLGTLSKAGTDLYNEFTGAWSTISSWAGGLLGDIGSAFSDPLGTITRASTTLFEKFKDAWDTVSSWAGGVISDITKGLRDPLETIKGASSTLFEKFKGAWNTVSSWGNEILGKVKKAFDDPLGTIKGAGTTLYNAFTEAWNKASSWASGILNTIKGALDDPLGKISGVATSLYDSFTGAWSKASSWAGGILTDIKNAFTDPLGTIKSVSGTLYTKFTDAWDKVSSWAGGVFEDIKKAFNDPVGTMKTKGEGLWNNLKSGFSGVQSWFTDNVVNPIEGAFTGMDSWATKTFGGVWSAIKSPFEGVYNWFKTNVADRISGAFRPILQFFGIDTGGDPLAGIKEQIKTSEAEVSKLKKEYDSAYQEWIEDRRNEGYGSSAERASYNSYVSKQTAYQQARNYLDGLKQGLAEQEAGSEGLGGIRTNIENAFSGLDSIIVKPFQDAWNSITEMFGGIGSWFDENVIKPIQNLLNPVGEAVSNGVVGGMVDAKQSITTGSKTIGDWILGALTGGLKINSPSKVMHDQVGLMIGAGIVEGMLDSVKSIRSASETLSDSVSIMGGGSSLAVGARQPTTVVYNQTINSPEPISVGQIYRDTRSLIGRREWS